MTGSDSHAFTQGILFRTVLIILSAFTLLGLVTVSLTAWSTSERIQQSADKRLVELLDTVESTVNVACFAQDEVLAAEVARGLLSNSEVFAVTILAGEITLSHVRKPPAATSNSCICGRVKFPQSETTGRDGFTRCRGLSQAEKRPL